MEPNRPEPGKEPLFHAPFQQPMAEPTVVSSAPEPSEPQNEGGQPKNKLMLAIGIAAAVELLVIIGLALAVATKSNPATPATQNGDDANSSQAEGPTAANSSNVQLIDDSISQDLSSLNDDKDFPADKFSDRSLNL